MGQTFEERREEQRERARAKRHEMMERHPTEHPHLLHLTLDCGVGVRVECPGREHCSLWYGTEDHGKCGVQLEAEEVGSEFLEWMVGPETAPTNPLPIGFTWSGGGSDDPPEIEWWPL